MFHSGNITIVEDFNRKAHLIDNVTGFSKEITIPKDFNFPIISACNISLVLLSRHIVSIFLDSKRNLWISRSIECDFFPLTLLETKISSNEKIASISFGCSNHFYALTEECNLYIVNIDNGKIVNEYTKLIARNVKIFRSDARKVVWLDDRAIHFIYPNMIPSLLTHRLSDNQTIYNIYLTFFDIRSISISSDERIFLVRNNDKVYTIELQKEKYVVEIEGIQACEISHFENLLFLSDRFGTGHLYEITKENRFVKIKSILSDSFKKVHFSYTNTTMIYQDHLGEVKLITFDKREETYEEVKSTYIILGEPTRYRKKAI